VDNPKRAYLHVGLHKTGTTYLQNVLRANRAELLEQGVEYFADKDVPQRIATMDLTKTGRRGYNDPRIPGAWDRLAAGVARRGAPVVLISDEALAGVLPRHVPRAVKSFADREVHVIATVRDIGRVLVSQWQEQIKNDHTWTWDEYVTAVRDPSRAGSAPARPFWWRQDVCGILAKWQTEVPADRIHVVTVPPKGSPSDLLLERLAAVVGFNPDALPNEPKWQNESVGVAGTEVIRRVNERFGKRLTEPEYSRAVPGTLARLLATRPDAGRFALPSEHLDWAMRHAEETIATLKERGYPVMGDLKDLLVVPDTAGRRPDDYTTEELLDASLDCLAAVLEDYATSWWSRNRVKVEEGRRGSGMQVMTRGARIRVRRGLLAAANRSPMVGRVLARALRHTPPSVDRT
jgi:hypothetical protein